MRYTSPLFSDARKKLGDAVFSRDSQGTVVRARVGNVNNHATAQGQQRSRFAVALGAWASLTQTQRNQWAALASQTWHTTSLGQRYNPTGRTLYVQGHMNLRTFFMTPTLDHGPPPHTFDSASPVQAAVTYLGGTWLGIILAVSTSGGPGIALKAFAFTRPLSPAVTYADRSQYRVLAPPYDVMGGEYIITTGYTNRFGFPPVGSQVGVRVAQFDYWTGLPLESVTALVTVTDLP
jgi:hypothetical protein